MEKKADIISMSWTIPIPEEGSPTRTQIDEVLKRACEQKILMFCSSPDQKSQTRHYPWHYDRDKIFLIGAADDSGTAYNHSGPDSNFIFPGVNVNTSNKSYTGDPEAFVQRSTGSSIATALAAGLAAMVTYCFKASAIHSVTTRIAQGKPPTGVAELVKPEDVDKIAQHDGLKKAFERIGPLDEGKFIAVWEVFGPATKCLTDGKKTYEEKITKMMNLCRNLMDRIDR